METNVKLVKSVVGSEISEPDVSKALSQCDNNVDAAINLIFDSPSSFPSTTNLSVQKTVTSTGGARISTFKLNLGTILEDSEEDGKKNESFCQSEARDDEPSSDEDLDDELKIHLEVCEEYKRVESLGQSKAVKQEQPTEENGGCEGFSEGKTVYSEKSDMGFVLKEDLKRVEARGSIGRSGLSFSEWLRLQENGKSSETEERNPEVNGEVKVEPMVDDKRNDSGFFEEGLNSQENEKSTRTEEIKTEIDTAFSVDSFMEEYWEWLRLQERNKSNEKEEMKPETNSNVETKAKEEPSDTSEGTGVIVVKEEVEEVVNVQPLSARKLCDDEYKRIQLSGNTNNRNKPEKENRQDMRLSVQVIEDGDFPEDPDWLLVGRTVITGLSTTKGRKLENNEIVHFVFPNAEKINKSSTHFTSFKAASAASTIVRFSTKRSGEIGRLPMDWAKCLVPLVNSSKVKVLGRCVAAPINLHLMQEIMLYVSFYIHHSIFTEGDTSSWKLEQTNVDTTIYPLLTLFKMLKVNPFQKAEFTPEELDSRKRSLKLDGDSEYSDAVVPSMKKRKGCQLQEQNNDEQCIAEFSLNKLVGAADVYNLEEMEPPETLTCDLRPYQKQALYWMCELEKGASAEEAGKTLHPCWAAYRVCDERAPEIYVNIFSGEATTKFPTATQMARGGILADAMGLGKTVMTIALILARRGRGCPGAQQLIIEDESQNEYIKNKKKDSKTKASCKVKGGTLIICPMALLGQWKDELETHSKPDSISVSVYYGGGRANDPKVIAEPDVVLTTYGVLQSAYKTDSVNSIFHGVEWHRVVLDEAHTIKSSKTQAAQAAFALSSYSRWCLTGTPLQPVLLRPLLRTIMKEFEGLLIAFELEAQENNLEDLYSLLCFLKVEPWCNWAWWNKLIQRPYENGDQRGLKLVKAILRPLMLRRTKESKDKEGRPILVLPPTDVQIIECEQSEAEHDFYDALFKRSKVQFDQFVAQGRVLHNYANILELLLRLRQCCNHPFLVMSRGNTEEYADLNKLARRFLNPDSSTQTGPSRAYVEEVVEGLRNGENTECPICLESADDPILTPCAHRMCRECILSSWRSPSAGLCPICRQMLKKTELITCPSGGRFRIDVEKNWKESSKISKLLSCLQGVQRSGEKSIVFSQWTSFLDLLEIPLKRRNIGFLRFDGRLSEKQREKVLHEFSETQEKMVLLMSLKAGGVGLNLTAASNVFLMDPWWNPAVEEQAIMRIHRIGQKRTVRVRRFIVKDTVEERMQQVQGRKQRMIAGALTDEEVRSARLEELKMLFR